MSLSLSGGGVVGFENGLGAVTVRRGRGRGRGRNVFEKQWIRPTIGLPVSEKEPLMLMNPETETSKCGTCCKDESSVSSCDGFTSPEKLICDATSSKVVKMTEPVVLKTPEASSSKTCREKNSKIDVFRGKERQTYIVPRSVGLPSGYKMGELKINEAKEKYANMEESAQFSPPENSVLIPRSREIKKITKNSEIKIDQAPANLRVSRENNNPTQEIRAFRGLQTHNDMSTVNSTTVIAPVREISQLKISSSDEGEIYENKKDHSYTGSTASSASGSCGPPDKLMKLTQASGPALAKSIPPVYVYQEKSKLTAEDIQRIRVNKPQNFNAGQSGARNPLKGYRTCTNGCGQHILIGNKNTSIRHWYRNENKIKHDEKCEALRKHLESIKRFEEAYNNRPKDVPTPATYDESCRSKKVDTGFCYGVGAFVAEKKGKGKKRGKTDRTMNK